MSEAYIGAFEAGDEGAIELMIDFYGGSGTLAAWPERVGGYARQTTVVNNPGLADGLRPSTFDRDLDEGRNSDARALRRR
jgi:hypothetical protein